MKLVQHENKEALANTLEEIKNSLKTEEAMDEKLL